MPRRPEPRRFALLVAFLAIATLVVPTASTAIEGEIVIDMRSLEETGIEATLTLTGGQADEIR